MSYARMMDLLTLTLPFAILWLITLVGYVKMYMKYVGKKPRFLLWLMDKLRFKDLDDDE